LLKYFKIFIIFITTHNLVKGSFRVLKTSKMKIVLKMHI